MMTMMTKNKKKKKKKTEVKNKSIDISKWSHVENVVYLEETIKAPEQVSALFRIQTIGRIEEEQEEEEQYQEEEQEEEENTSLNRSE